MTTAQIFTLARFLTNTNANSATDANLLRCITERERQLTLWLTELREGYLETSTTSNLVSGTESYALPTDALAIKRVEITYDGTNWKPVTIYDLNEKTSLTNDTTAIAGNFSKSAPHGDISGNNILLRPIPDANVTNGLKVWYVALPSEISATSTTPSSPKEYHRYLADLLAIDIRQMKGELSGSQSLMEEEAVRRFVKFQASPRIDQEDQVAKPMRINYR